MAGKDSGHLVGTPGRAPPDASAPVPLVDSGTKRRVRSYAWSLFAVASVAVVVLAASGAPLPGLVPVVAFGVVVAMSVNQYAFFPSEWSATAEDAVLVAAVVGFGIAPFGHGADLPFGHGAGAALLGPAAVGFLCGPLDLLHWRERAVWRMAYNSGSRMIAALVGATVFGVVRGASDFRIRLVLAAVAVSLVFAFVDLVLFVGFEKVRGEQSIRAAAREDLLIDCLTVPLCLVGAVAGWVAVEAAWWAGALVLVPTVFAPELVLVRGRRALQKSRAGARALRTSGPIVIVGAAVVGAVVAFAPLPAPAVLAGLAVLALVAGFELQTETRAPVPAAGLAAIVVAAMVVGGDAAVATAVVVAVVTTTTVWVLAQRSGWWVPVLAAGAAAVSVAAFDTPASPAGALGAALVFQLVLFTRLPRIVWTAPLVCTALALAEAWREIGPAAGSAFASALVATCGVAALWGAPPWGSRVLGPWGARNPTCAHRAIVLTTAALSLGLAAAAAATQPGARGLFALGASATAASVALMAMVGVRQWRFAPRARARAAATVLVAAVLVVIPYPSLALDGRRWSVAILVVALAVCAAIAWPLARLADFAARTEAPRTGNAPVP